MKTIQPLSIWSAGNTKSALFLSAYAVNVTLNKSANFHYSLLDENHTSIINDNITMDEEDYQNWDSDDEYVYNWIATKLNLTITGDYVAPEPIVEEVIVNEEISE